MPGIGKPASRPLVPVLPVRDAVHFPRQINTLHVARDLSLRALRKSLAGDRLVAVISQRDMGQDAPNGKDLYEVGTLSEVLQSIPLPDATQRAALRGLHRVRARCIQEKDQALWAEVDFLEETGDDDVETQALMRACVESFSRIIHLDHAIPPEALQCVINLEDAGLLADTILHHSTFRPSDKQILLEEPSHRIRLQGVMRLLKQEEQVLMLNEQIHQKVQRELGDTQREFYLREQLRIIQNELRQREDRVDEAEEYVVKIRAAGMPPAVEVAVLGEAKRLDRTPPSSPESLLSRNYLDTLLGLPWNEATEETLDVAAAEHLLEDRHHGLKKVKDRILDHLAVCQLRGSLRGSVLCFVGPPGVGKTSIARSIADAMNRRFIRISLGGLRDEAEIRGHRRTYVGAMPGRILQGIRDSGSRNPVILLDEIDKIGSNGLGDPANALLEVLDPESNPRFVDHFIDLPFDLSAVMFIATANVVENIHAALRDRMEIIRFPSYTTRERTEIANRFLLPRGLKEHGLQEGRVTVSQAVIDALVRDYTSESGVRDLKRSIAAVCRKAAREIANGAQAVEVTPDVLLRFLGPPRNRRTSHLRRDEIGTAYGTVVSDVGGEVVPIEVSLVARGNFGEELRLTGNLGQIMKESAQAALTAVLGSMPDFAGQDFDVHVHVPEGAIPKEGPSAGVTVAVAIASALRNAPVRSDTAMTGEITLRGRILPVGGISEKVIAAHREGLKRILLPKANLEEVGELPDYVRAGIDILPISSLEEAIEQSFAIP